MPIRSCRLSSASRKRSGSARSSPITRSCRSRFSTCASPSADTNGENVFAMDGNARYRGVEVSLQGDLTRDLSVIASAVHLDAKQVDSPDPTLVGKTPENAAHVTANLFADYRIPAVAGLSINGGLYYIGPRAVNDLDQASIGGYTLLTAGLRYT